MVVSMRIDKALLIWGAINNTYFDIGIVAIISLLIWKSPAIKQIKFFKLKRCVWNTIIVNILSLLTIFILSNIVYYRCFDFFGPSNLYNFISDNKISKINEDMVFLLRIEKVMNEFVDNVDNGNGKFYLYKFSEIVSKNKEKSKQLFINDKIISGKFKEYNISFEDILNYYNNCTKFQSNLILSGYFIGTLLFLIILSYYYERIFIADEYDLFKIKIKKIIYIVAFGIYFISVIDINNDGLVSYMINIKYGTSIIISKEQLSDFMKFFSTFKEGFVTFIIFDTIIDCSEKLNKLSRKNTQRFNPKSESSADISNNTLKKINSVASKYDIIKKENKNIEENIKRQNIIINELQREIKNLQKSKHGK